MKTIIVSSMLLLSLLLTACNEEGGCEPRSQGTIPGQQTGYLTLYAETSINCETEIEKNYEKLEDMTAIDTAIKQKGRVKLIHDGNEPSWAPETITVGQITACEYGTPPAPNTNCEQSEVSLYYSAAETNINYITVHLSKYTDSFNGMYAHTSEQEVVPLAFDTPEIGTHQAYYKKDPNNKYELTYFYYENQ